MRPLRLPAPAVAVLLAALLSGAAAACGGPDQKGAASAASATTAPGPQDGLTHNLKKLLARDGVTQATKNPVPQGTSSATTALELKSGAGDVRVQVVVNRLPVPVSPLYSNCPDSALHPYSTCTVGKHRGADLALDRSPVDESAPAGAQRWTAALTFADGRQVVVVEGPADRARGRTVTGPELPLTLQELTDIAGSPSWDPFLASLSQPDSRPDPQVNQTAPPQRITETMTGLLPRTLKIADEGGRPGYGHLTVDDGRGKCLVAVTVQRWKPGDSTLDDLFSAARRLPDGTRITTSRSAAKNGGKGAIEWRVDLLGRDGLRVVVSELNTRAYRLPGTRTTPAVSVEQLTDLVRSSAWRKVAAATRP
ncbi:hypothetical protein ACH4A8_29510 [Streptomyces vietnamensis]|uniref:hypothetical protein n=1 Tax=Streptomyces vietnamensis TaxID=362257 RepID=UPI003797FE52